MSPGAKIFLTLGAVAGVIGVIAVAAPAKASPLPKQPKQPKPSNAPPDVIVQPPGQDPISLPPLPMPPVPVPGGNPFGPSPAPIGPGPVVAPVGPANVPPLPSAPPQPQLPQTPPGVTVSLPNPLGGAPLGTFDPATGNVFGPGGIIIGTFNPATGIFTAATGQQVQIPGFGPQGGGALPIVPAPTPTPAAPLPPVQPVQSGQVQPTPPAPPPAPAPVTTVSSDTASMVSALLQQEGSSGWNKKDPNVNVFQGNRGLVVDGEYGVKSALAAAKELGTLPLIRFWPAGSQKASALQDYQTQLLTLANSVASTDPTRAAQLRHSAARETAQAFGVKGKAPAIPAANQVSIAQVA